MAPFVKQFLRLDGNFLQKRRKAPPQTPDSRTASAPPPQNPPPSCPPVPECPAEPLRTAHERSQTSAGKVGHIVSGQNVRAVRPEGRAAESRNGSADRLPFRMDFPLHRLALLQSSCTIKSRRS